MRLLPIILLSLTIFACKLKSQTEKLAIDELKYSAYSWRLSSDTPVFYLAHYLDISNNGHYIFMRHDSFLDTPKYFKGDIPDTLIKVINEAFETDNYSTDYSIKPEDSFIYDGFTYCLDYKKKDSLSKKIQFIPNKSPEQIKRLGLLLDELIYPSTANKTNKFNTDKYSIELSKFSLQVSGPLPKLEKPYIIIRN